MSDHEIKVHYWPETPQLREIKFSVFGKVELSIFLNKKEIEHFAKVLLKASEGIVND